MLKKKIVYIAIWALGILTLASNQSYAQSTAKSSDAAIIDTTGNLVYPFDDEGAFQYPNQIDKGPLYLKSPANIDRKLEYDPVTRQYVMYEKIGGIYYRLPKTMSLKNYIKYDFDESIKDYWRSRKEVEEIATGEKSTGLIPQIKIESEAFTNIFGSDIIDIKPQGYVEVSFGLQSTYSANPILPERLRRNTNFDFDDQINLSVRGKIGDKIDMEVNYNTEATFDFENKFKIDYAGKEDEILRKIEAGNVSLPLNGSLIQGGTNLFGVKTEMQFGKLNLTTIISQHKGESQVIESEGGAQKTKFEIQASDYDENRHFFLSKYFRDHYDKALSRLPKIYTQIVINKVEVWVTNTSQNFAEARDIVAFVDLGEHSGKNGINISNNIFDFRENTGMGYPEDSIPFNGANKLYEVLTKDYSGIRESKFIFSTMAPLQARGFRNSTHWEKIDQARKLNESDYFINEELGFISLNSPLNNDEVLAVAFNFTVGDSTYQVGEFTSNSTDSKQTLILKLLKGTNLSPNLPTWDLMMKNVYNLGAYDLTSQDFDFNIVYKNDSTNTFVNSLPADGLNNKILLKVMNLDNLNSQLDYTPDGDGMYDFIEGVTVISQSGRIIFPVLEPFGSNIANLITDTIQKKKYSFLSLYNNTKNYAEQEDFNHNKFFMVGSYKGLSSSEISLNAFNLAPGSVKVSAGGTPLQENVDYTVDYASGKVKIINPAYIDAGTPIQVSTESQDMISMQRKTMVGTYASYAASEKLNIGGTLLYMNERPMTNKVDMGEEPVSNLMLGLDFQYRNKIPLLTDLLNFLPFYESKNESSISIEGEVAKLFPGSSKTTGNNVYIDDFESVETTIPMSSPYNWQLASAPQGQSKFPEATDFTNDLTYGYNRAKIAWYEIDQLMTQAGSSTPAHISADLDMRSNHYMRSVLPQEIFPGRERALMSSTYQHIFNLAYFPSEKGPYNYDTEPTKYSKGIASDGRLRNPESRWGGIMCDITSPNFESSNIEYIEFWLLDPFIYDTEGTNKGGDLFINLGNISEDILKDSRKAFENGLPADGNVTNVDTTSWGRVSTDQMLKPAFTSADAESRSYQDVGFDGLRDQDEVTFFDNYLKKIEKIVSQDVYQKVFADPSADNFHYYKGEDYDKQKLSIIGRYKNFNGLEGNTPVAGQSQNDIISSSKIGPDVEDLNKDNTMNQLESYFQYRVSLRPEDMEIGKNNIVDKVERKVALINAKQEIVNWYQFKIPVRKPDETIGDNVDLKSIRFMRMFLTNFADSIILRFGTLSLIRSDWRVERKDLLNEDNTIESPSTIFEMTSINIEENQSRKPINYILPPGIERETDPTNPTPILMNEQSMLLKVNGLESGTTKSVFKNVGLDMRQYKRLKMEVHAEAIEGSLSDNELSLIVRLGSDYDNYYEYEIPLKITPIPSTPYVEGEINSSDRYAVWPDENRLDLDLSIFPALKLKRDEEIRKAGAKTSRNVPYTDFHEGYQGGKNIIRVKGNPSIGEVEIIHVGIKNPKDKKLGPKSVEIWVNELRLSDFDERGGWASNGRMSLQLADLGNISLSGRTQSVGWGGINQVASQRSLDDKYQYDFAANVELGKLLPEKAGVHLPIYYNVSKSVSSPQYNPLSSDIKMTDALALIDSPEEKDFLKSISQDVVTRKSFTVNNVTIEPERKKADRKPLPTDIENFSVSYAYSAQNAQNIDIEEQVARSEKGSFDYNYSITSQPIEPFRKVKFLDNDFLQIIKDFNFSLLPEMISFRTDYQKNYAQRKARDNSGMEIELPRTIQKDFLWNRNFDLRYNLTRNLKFDFRNKNVNRVDQLDGLEDRNIAPTLFDSIQNTLWENIKSFGRPVEYEHSVDIQYTVPINKLPLLDFTSSQVTYRGNYEWLAGPRLAPPKPNEDTINVGNTIRNGMNISASAQFNLLTLYNKVPYLKKVNDKYQSTTRRYGSKNKSSSQRNAKPEAGDAKKSRTKEVKFSEKKVSFKADIPKSIFHKLGTEKVRITILDAKGDTIKGEISIVNENRVNFKSSKNVSNAEVFVVGTIDNSEPIAKMLLDGTTRILMGIRSIRASYTQTGGTEMPGFLGEPQAFHFGSQQFPDKGGVTSSLAPGIPFLMGWQDKDFAMKAAKIGWITEDTTIQKRFLDQRTVTWNFGFQVEPFSNIKIDVTGNRRESINNSCFIQYNSDEGSFEKLSNKESGNFDMTIFTLRTAFKERLNNDTLVSGLFNQFRDVNRPIIAARLNKARGFVEGKGYTTNPLGDTLSYVSEYSSDVIIPAFLAAYTGISPAKIPLTARPGLAWIRPNWRINYNGDPQNVEWMKSIFNTLNFTHSYRATYSIGRFESNLAYKPDDDSGLSWVRSQLDKEVYFVPQLDINSINIQEDFSPLINIDAGFVNDLSANFEMRRTRTLNFSFSNMQLSEMVKNEYSIGIGYRFTGMDMIIKTKRKSESVSNDVNMRLELSSSDYKTTFRQIDKEEGLLQSGMKLFSLDFQADYMISDKLTIKFYYNFDMRNPHLGGGSEGFMQKETKLGFSFNYSIM